MSKDYGVSAAAKLCTFCQGERNNLPGEYRPCPECGLDDFSHWYCDQCHVEVRDRRCMHCGKLERDPT